MKITWCSFSGLAFPLVPAYDDQATAARVASYFSSGTVSAESLAGDSNGTGSGGGVRRPITLTFVSSYQERKTFLSFVSSY